MKTNAFNTPVLLITFKKPETTKIVFEEIRKARPKKLFISSDGGRNEEEWKVVEEVRKIISNVDWPCKVKKRFLKENNGIIKGALGAIDWFFENVEEGIVFDDDCVPSQSFFQFCSEMLKKYRHDERIMHICGNNNQRGWTRDDYSYYFSKYTYMWGWASWKRAWKKYDVKMSSYLELLEKGFFLDICPNIFERIYLKKIMNNAYKNPKAVDTKWLFSSITNYGLTIVPNKNLIQNIGFTESATNTKKVDSHLSLQKEDLSFPLKHPPFVLLNRRADERYARWMLKNSIKKHLLKITGLHRIFM